MIDIEIRDKNRLVTLSVPGKTPIRSRGGPFFHNSMELLCVAVGSCFGKELSNYCYLEGINPRIFESIKITMENHQIKIHLSHPKDFDQEQLDEIVRMARTCPVAKQLSRGVEIELHENSIPTEDLVDESKNAGCCGG